MFDDDPPMVRLSRWFHAESFTQRAVGAVAKLVLEGGFWTAAMAGFVTLGVVAPLPFVGGVALFSPGHVLAVTSTAAAATLAEFCLFTLPPGELD